MVDSSAYTPLRQGTDFLGSNSVESCALYGYILMRTKLHNQATYTKVRFVAFYVDGVQRRKEILYLQMSQHRAIWQESLQSLLLQWLTVLSYLTAECHMKSYLRTLKGIMQPLEFLTGPAARFYQMYGQCHPVVGTMWQVCADHLVSQRQG
jgi:hypothetical protein